MHLLLIEDILDDANRRGFSILRMLKASDKHNVMLGKKIPHPKSTLFDHFEKEATESAQPSPKRIKLSPCPQTASSSSKREHSGLPLEIPDSDFDSDDGDLQAEHEENVSSRKTDLESALPPIDTDREAIEAYEASKFGDDQTDVGLQERLDGRHWVKGRSSIYVDAFNLTLETVLAEESHLFNDAERAVFDNWNGLNYEAQYLYVRLFLRKTSSWHRINRLGYHRDVAELPRAIEALQASRDLPAASSQTENHPGELEPPVDTTLDTTFTFADKSEDCITTLEEASSLLLLDELKAIAKDAKVQGKNKKELLQALRRTSGKQTGLGWSSLKRSDTEETTLSNGSRSDSREATPGRLENRDAHFLDTIMAETGPCIRLSLPALKLFERVHLVFYRSTEWTEKSLTTLILARIARRNFPSYIVSRSSNIFASRSLLLEFEAALRTQFRVDNILEFNGPPTKESFQTILTIFEEVHPRWRILLAEEQRKEDSIYSTGEGAYLRRLSPAWVYTRIVHKAAYVFGKLKEHLREHEVLVELLEQRLFHTSRRGDWYQRKALLEEHYMHAHLPSPSSCKDLDSKKKHWKQIALQTCEQGLQDQMTHLIFHHDLQKRTVKLEKSLKVPKRLQHDFGHVRLAKAAERTFEGVRIERPPPTGPARRNSEQAKLVYRSTKTIWLDPAPAIPSTLVEEDASDFDLADQSKASPPADIECSVEQMCLSSYRALGWKGFHTESSILRTLFALLFHDVLFLYIPNVFQTAYQTCPLDLHTDGFYTARMSECNQRLNEIANGSASEILGRTWDELDGRNDTIRHKSGLEDGEETSETEDTGGKKTCVIGLDWSFDRSDLVEIAAAFPPAALASVMKVLAQEYGQRGGGVPDLFLWKPPQQSEARQMKLEGLNASLEDSSLQGEVMFAEVKSENDRLSDTQRMWIDVLSGAGVKVELCHAVAKEVRVRENK